MSERTVIELGRLAEEIGDRVVVPAFGDVEARAHRRRRSRRAVAAAVAAAMLVAAGAGVALSTDRPTPRPSPSAPTEPGLPAEVAKLVADPRSHPFELAGGPDGSLAVVWRDLVQPEPTFALVVRDLEGATRGRLLDQPFDLTAVTGGWVAAREGARTAFVGTDGSVTDLTLDPTRVAPQAGDVLVPAPGRFLLWRSVTQELLVADIAANAESALVTETGVLATYVPGQGLLVGDVRAEVIEGTRTVVLAGHGDFVSAAMLGDAPDGSIPALGVLLTRDAGAHGRSLSPASSTITDTTSFVVTRDGHTLSTGTTGDLTVLGPRGRRAESTLVGVRGLTVAGDRVYALNGTDDKGRLWWSEDAAATWHVTTLPGLEE